MAAGLELDPLSLAELRRDVVKSLVPWGFGGVDPVDLVVCVAMAVAKALVG